MSNEFKFNFCVGAVPTRMQAKIVRELNVPEVSTEIFEEAQRFYENIPRDEDSPKVLIGRVVDGGKSVEFEVPDSMEELPDCISIVKVTPRADAPLLPVPEGLSRCPTCDEYKGVMALKDIPNLDPFNQDVNPDTPLRVQCICDGVL